MVLTLGSAALPLCQFPEDAFSEQYGGGKNKFVLFIF